MWMCLLVFCIKVFCMLLSLIHYTERDDDLTQTFLAAKIQNLFVANYPPFVSLKTLKLRATRGQHDDRKLHKNVSRQRLNASLLHLLCLNVSNMEKMSKKDREKKTVMAGFSGDVVFRLFVSLLLLYFYLIL